MSCECAQGYYIARPMDAVIFDEWFLEYSKNKKLDATPINSDVVIKRLN
jgi:hypothetical protein